MKQSLERLKEWFAQLEPRERLIVGAGAIIVAVTVLYLALWEPLVRAHTGREAALAAAREVASRLEVAATQVQKARQGGGTNRNLSLLSAVDQATKSSTLGKAPSRIQPEGDKEVKVWFEDVPFDNLLRWLGELQTRYGVSAVSAEIERESGPGLVNARLSLVRS